MSLPRTTSPYVPEDGLPAPARARGVAPLGHEVPDNAVKTGAVVIAHARKLRKVEARLRGMSIIQLDREISLHEGTSLKNHREQNKFMSSKRTMEVSNST